MVREVLVLLYFSGGVGLLADSARDTTGVSIKSLGDSVTLLSLGGCMPRWGARMQWNQLRGSS